MIRSVQNEIKNQVENSLRGSLYLILHLFPHPILVVWFFNSLERQPNPGGPEQVSSIKAGVILVPDPTRSTISYVDCIGWGQEPKLLQQLNSNWPPRIGLKRFQKEDYFSFFSFRCASHARARCAQHTRKKKAKTRTRA